MTTITVKDGTTIYYKDWGTGPVVTFSHGWPLNSDAWDGQLLFLAQNGFRVVAHDRRGHGRSSQAWSGNDMDGYADDLASLIETLDLKEVTLVGHSTGGGEVTRYIGRHGTKRVAAAVLIGAVPPILVKSAANPEGIPIEVFDGLRSSIVLVLIIGTPERLQRHRAPRPICCSHSPARRSVRARALLRRLYAPGQLVDFRRHMYAGDEPSTWVRQMLEPVHVPPGSPDRSNLLFSREELTDSGL
jgi:pimeloyl-ACP methyl ester carboxylesterase